MSFEIVGREGPFAQQRFPVGDVPITFGRHASNSVVVVSKLASRFHAEILPEGGGYVLYDRESSNGTTVNGEPTASHVLRPGDLITIGDEVFCWEPSETQEASPPVTQLFVRPGSVSGPVMNVTVSGGGPVGLAFALLTDHLLGGRASVTVYDARWTRDNGRVVWKNEKQGNVRRQQVVTVQSRQYLNLSEEMQERLFAPGAYTEMWPSGADSIGGRGPRNIRISRIEDVLLEMASERPGRIKLVPEKFNVTGDPNALDDTHVLAVCEGSRSRSREHFTKKFGQADTSIYSLDGQHLEDVVLGLRVKSKLSDPATVLLTVAQNRYLLNSLEGQGFLNMRLTDAEAQEVVGIDPVRQVFEQCIGSRPCVMARDGEDDDFSCSTHNSLFLPSLIKGSPLWKRVRQGLELFGVPESDLKAVTAFRLSMVQRPRFTAELRPPGSKNPGTYGFLLGDAANAIHFWPGRGLNSGLASAISLARSLSSAWNGRPFRDSDFIRHEAAMSMLQYRHKSRAWKAMVTAADDGSEIAIKDKIAQSIETAGSNREADLETLLERLGSIRERLSARIPGMPDDASLRDHLGGLSDETLRSLVAGGPWDTLTVGGEEVDIDIFYREEAEAAKG
ncbi:FHA domain-containing protein [Nocardiopsis sp. LOL_012]|uniref:FHA domain-containing protein n=1 Tax=Nocardiopsis sp. LOL_012 TaxID=3345409 RepID=UPI003A86D636